MNKFLCLFMILAAIARAGAAAALDIGAGETFVAGGYRMTASGTITNRGLLSGTVFIDGNIQILVRNHGDMPAEFVLSDGASLIHGISSASEIIRLDVSGGRYVPTIGSDFAGIVSASDLLSLGTVVAVEKAMLEVNILMSELSALAGIARMSGGGSLRLNIADYDGRPLVLPEFDGPATVSVGNIRGDPMFRYAVSGGVARRVRETDYAAIFGNSDNKAAFLNLLRARDPDNKIIRKFDSAETLPELRRMMAKSMFFNPLVLNDGIVLMMTRPDFYDIPKLGSYADAKAVIDGGNSGTVFGLGFSRDDFSLSLGLYSGSIAEDGDYKYGTAGVRGASALARYKMFGFGAKEFSADWDGIAIARGTDVKTGAKSRLFYSFFDISPEFGNVRPIVRFNYAKSEIAGYSDDKFFISYGAGAYYSEKIMGVENKYGLYAMRGLDTDFGIAVDSHFIEDGISFSVKLSPRNVSVGMRAGF